MANKDHLEILNKGVDDWNKWRKSNPDIIPDLREADLSRKNLSRADLRNANLSRADLSEVVLSGAYLRRAYLSGANLSEAELSGSNLTRAGLRIADLNRADLSGSNLIKANLRDADLNRANLRRANLSRTDLSDANLSGANLREANLREANLNGANLNGADLTKATVLETNLIMADLSGADLSNSEIGMTILSNTDLSNVKGLDTIKHLRPSLISINTIYISKGKIPEIFLRGAGVPENFIQYIPSLVSNPFEFYSCFISYSHNNKDFARLLHDRLQGQGVRCWLDEHQFLPGDDLHDTIDRGIRIWDKVILCCSEASLTSWWVDKELDRALQKEERLWKERQKKVLAIIPVDLDGYVHFWDGGKAAMLKSRFIGDFKDWKNNDEFEKSFEKLLPALRTPESREPAPTPKL